MILSTMTYFSRLENSGRQISLGAILMANYRAIRNAISTKMLA